MLVYYKLYKKTVSPVISTPRCGDQENGNPRRWGCAREGKKRSSSCLLNERLPFLLANHYIISQQLSSKPQPAPHKHETDVANPQYLLHWQHLIPQNQIAAVYVLRSVRMKPQRVLPNPEALNPSGEGRDKAVPVSTFADRSVLRTPGPQPSLCLAAAGPEPWETRAWASSKKTPGGIGASVSISQCSQPAFSNADCVCSSPQQAIQRMCVSPPVK